VLKLRTVISNQIYIYKVIDFVVIEFIFDLGKKNHKKEFIGKVLPEPR